MKKKFIGLAVIFVLLFSLSACSQGLDAYKEDAKQQIESYANDKGQENYSETNWATICGIVETGKAAVDEAEHKTGVDSAVEAAREEIDVVGKEESVKKVAFELGNKTTDYFEVDGRGQLLKMVESMDELAQLMAEKQFSISPTYDAAFFEEHALILFFFTESTDAQFGIELKKTDSETLTIVKKYIDEAGNTIPVPHAFIMELNKTDIVGITKLS